jgi:hypothetical protein
VTWFWRAACRLFGHLWLSESIVEHVFSPSTMRHEHVELAIMRCERCGTWWDDLEELEDGDDE